MKKIIALVLALAMTATCMLALTSCGNDNEIIIGVFEPASGDNGAGGKQETLGVRYANKVKSTVTLGGKEYKVTLKIVDNQSSNDKAPTAAAELVNAGAKIVLGSYGSGVSIAAGNVFKEAKVPALGITCTNPQVTAENEYYFRACFLDPFQGTVLANYAKDLGATKAYVLAQLGNDYDVGLATYFKTAFGVSDCVYENFQQNEQNFTAFVQKAIDEDCGVIFAPTSLSYAKLIIEKAAALNYTGTILAGDTWDSNVVTETAKGKGLNIKVTTFYNEGANAEFDNGFRAWLNSDSQLLTDNGGNDLISAVSAMGYDSYMTALYAIEHSGAASAAELTGDMIKTALVAMENATTGYTGVTGTIFFDGKGDAVRTSAFIKAADNANSGWIFVKEQTIAD